MRNTQRTVERLRVRGRLEHEIRREEREVASRSSIASASRRSSSSPGRATNEWETEYRAYQKRSLADLDCVYVWGDGVHFLDKLPRRLQPRAKVALREVMYAENRARARDAIMWFARDYGAKYPKAVTTLEQDGDALLTFFDFPAERWKHFRTSNVIQSPFATVRLRQRVTKGAGSRTNGLLMAYKLLDMAQGRWRRLDVAHPLPLVRAGIVFVDGVRQEGKATKTRARAA